MREEGFRIICDRCGKTEFFRQTGKRLVDTADGFKTRAEYESSEKWEEQLINHKHYYFCPACNEQYMRMVIDFAKPLNSFTEKD